MAEFGTHTHLPPVSRRTVLAGAITTPLVPASGAEMSGFASDPIRPLWSAWRQAVCDAASWGARWAALESELVRSVGFPRVRLPDAAGGRETWAISAAQIDAALGDGPESDPVRTRLRANLARRQARWDAAVAQTGLEEADQREAAAMALSADLAERLCAIPARNLPGAIIKLEVILNMGETHDADDDFPWGWLRATIADLKRLAAEAGIPLPD